MSVISYLSGLLSARPPIAPMPIAPATPTAKILEAFSAASELVPTQDQPTVQTPTGGQPGLWSRFIAAVMGVKATITSFFSRTPDTPAGHALRQMHVEQIAPTQPAGSGSGTPSATAVATGPQPPAIPTAETTAPAAPWTEERVKAAVTAAIDQAFRGCDDLETTRPKALQFALGSALRSLRTTQPEAFESGALADAVVAKAVQTATAQVREFLYVPTVEELSRQAAQARPIESAEQIARRFDQEVLLALPPGVTLHSADFQPIKATAIQALAKSLQRGPVRGEQVTQVATGAVGRYLTRHASEPTATQTHTGAQSEPPVPVSASPETPTADTPRVETPEESFERYYKRALELEAQMTAADAQSVGKERGFIE